MGWMIYLAVVFALPIASMAQVLYAHSDAFLMLYTTADTSALVFYQNLYVAFINIPLCAVNWVTLEATNCGGDGEGGGFSAVGALIIPIVVIFVLASLFYG